MIVVLASRYDTGARSLVERWAEHDARVMTCEDLSAVGWFYSSADPAAGKAVIGRQPVAIDRIRGVVTRLPWVTERELISIVPADRAYVAAEMSAFLAAWLSDLDCPVMNRPTPGSLTGPAWRREQWMCLAGQVGMRVRPEIRRVSLGSALMPPRPLPATTIWVVGGRCLGEAAPILLQQARRLAAAANVGLLGVCFSDAGPDASFLETSVYPDIDRDDLTEAMSRYILAHDRPDASN